MHQGNFYHGPQEKNRRIGAQCFVQYEEKDYYHDQEDIKIGQGYQYTIWLEQEKRIVTAVVEHIGTIGIPSHPTDYIVTYKIIDKGLKGNTSFMARIEAFVNNIYYSKPEGSVFRVVTLNK